jgi:hypothetical protein
LLSLSSSWRFYDTPRILSSRNVPDIRWILLVGTFGSVFSDLCKIYFGIGFLWFGSIWFKYTWRNAWSVVTITVGRVEIVRIGVRV